MGERLIKLKTCILFVFCFLLFANQFTFALELDTSIDDEIRKNYNPSKIEDDMGLPPLPKIYSESSPTPIYKKQISNTPKTNISTQVQRTKNLGENFVTIKKGTKFKVKSQGTISDRYKRGTKVSFISIYPVTTTYFTIPSGSLIYGEIVDSHKPQLTGNGGLIKIKLTSVVVNNGVQPLSAYVTKANSKHVFFNSIKGKRKFISSMLKSMTPGKNYMIKMVRITKNLAIDGSTVILTPFSLAAGVIGFGGNALVSPVIALFRKGNSISLPQNSIFEVKLDEDCFIYN